ncbi:hypothetical protein [Frankia sp. BMG5.23]|uniref:hypothetical protein n=1 Tax=Frankia sp. BMG5.23 TaxID=683305 RepID=UPI0005BBD2D4|nr:hypothetical protein [Frankia sp. BMG5.23]
MSSARFMSSAWVGEGVAGGGAGCVVVGSSVAAGEPSLAVLLPMAFPLPASPPVEFPRVGLVGGGAAGRGAGGPASGVIVPVGGGGAVGGFSAVRIMAVYQVA